ncbi:class I SAM-dependent methyltransferase [Acetivibrio clariflavus]|uniref:class I SAM-dependent methyltransferase n=1 Tax=Acetivibrio clariflavus TaxID=288965 RepID=UPI000481D672|nr:class I SAM-dependent methyltransferase [Acetivibrio clariflavus]
MKYEPTCLEIFLTRLAFLLCGKSVYQAFADRLPLDGGEQVLDFGCGMGTVAYYIAKKLPHGHLTCLDISERWLNTCQKTLRGYRNISFMLWEFPHFINESFDVVYCHFVLHDITESELKRVIPVLAEALKPGGVFVFREPFNETNKISLIKRLAEQNGLISKDSRITDIPMMGNALECVYFKK